MPETLTWEDQSVLVLPDETSQRAARWTQKLIDFIFENEDQPEMVERFVEALLIEERQEALLKVERALVKEI